MTGRGPEIYVEELVPSLGIEESGIYSIDVSQAPGTPGADGADGIAYASGSMTGELFTGPLFRVEVTDDMIGKDIREIRSSITSLPGTQAVKVDVRKNGTASTDSIFTGDVPQNIGTGESATNRLYMVGSDVNGSTVGSSGTSIDSARNTIAADDYFWIYVTQTGSSPTGTDLVVTIGAK